MTIALSTFITMFIFIVYVMYTETSYDIDEHETCYNHVDNQ